MDAAGQIFFSLGIGFGSLTLFSTGNKPKNSCFMDALLCVLGNCGTSVWAGIIMFSLFGFKADYKVKECEMSRNSSFKTNGSALSLPCSKDEVLNNVSPAKDIEFFSSRLARSLSIDLMVTGKFRKAENLYYNYFLSFHRSKPSAPVYIVASIIRTSRCGIVSGQSFLLHLAVFNVFF